MGGDSIKKIVGILLGSFGLVGCCIEHKDSRVNKFHSAFWVDN